MLSLFILFGRKYCSTIVPKSRCPIQQLSNFGFEHQTSLRVNVEGISISRICRVHHTQRREYDTPPVLSGTLSDRNRQRLIIPCGEIEVIIVFGRNRADAVSRTCRIGAPARAQTFPRPGLNFRQMLSDIRAADFGLCRATRPRASGLRVLSSHPLPLQKNSFRVLCRAFFFRGRLRGFRAAARRFLPRMPDSSAVESRSPASPPS